MYIHTYVHTYIHTHVHVLPLNCLLYYTHTHNDDILLSIVVPDSRPVEAQCKGIQESNDAEKCCKNPFLEKAVKE